MTVTVLEPRVVHPSQPRASLSSKASWDLAASYGYCVAMTASPNEGFPIATWLLPEALRQHVAAIYAFARGADDFADEPEFEGRRHEALDQWEDALLRAFHGEASHPVFVALADTSEKFSIPITVFRDLLAAFRMDLAVRRFATFSAVLQYCEKAANPVGRALLYLANDREPEHLRAADDFATALQLTRFLQHLARDYQRGRLYLPEDDLLRFSVSEADIKQARLSKNLRELLAFQVARARTLYLRAKPLCGVVASPLRHELKLTWLVGTTVLSRIEQRRFDVFSNKPALEPLDWARIGARLGAWRLRDFTQW